jgi:glycosyltransferase involved in cell wall biosynthesis
MAMNAQAPRMSVLMPTYEQAAFLPRALDSLLAQSLAEWEAIVIDDGSGAATREALAPWLRDPRVRYCRNERNEGLGRSLNMG